MDFRGRVYPITPYLNHMGDDLNRSLLVFAEGMFFHDIVIFLVNITFSK